MTLPDEEVRAIKKTHEFMSKILLMKISDFRRMSKDEFEAWRIECYYCIKHFPFDSTIDKLWADRLSDMEKDLSSLTEI